jgi:hypothetical protein
MEIELSVKVYKTPIYVRNAVNKYNQKQKETNNEAFKQKRKEINHKYYLNKFKKNDSLKNDNVITTE